MASNRRLAMCIILISLTLTIASFALLSWMNPLTIDILTDYSADFRITDIQFDNYYLNITVRNIGVNPTTISSVIINQTSMRHTIPAHEPILGCGEIISFPIAFKWTSGYRYQMKLETTDNFDYHSCNTFSIIAS